MHFGAKLAGAGARISGAAKLAAGVALRMFSSQIIGRRPQ